MDDKLTKLFNEFCKLKDELNTSNVSEKTVNIIGRLGKAIRSAEDIVLDPPKRDTYFDPELHLKTGTYAPLPKEEAKDWAKPVEKVVAQAVKKVRKPSLPKPPKARTIKSKK
ncbi:MAG: hypothetical protein V3V72_13670 [Ignavibacteriaceae bacterium]